MKQVKTLAELRAAAYAAFNAHEADVKSNPEYAAYAKKRESAKPTRTHDEQLMDLLKVDFKTARMVRDRCDENGLDNSGCTMREFNRAAREALAELKAEGLVG